jgi:hypothetical protein
MVRVALAAIVIAIHVASAARSQDLKTPPAQYPKLSSAAPSPEGFVPQGWKLEQKAAGDLDRDGIDDIAFVLHRNDAKNVIRHDGLGANPLDTNPRILAVAFGGRDGGYSLQLQNQTLIPRGTDPVLDDPLGEGALRIERGTLKVALEFFASAGGWETSLTTYTFRFQNGRFEMIGFDRNTTQRNSGKTTDISINYSTGKMQIATGQIEKDAKTTRTKNLPRRALPTVEQVGDGLAFDPARR